MRLVILWIFLSFVGLGEVFAANSKGDLWQTSYEEAWSLAQREGKPLFLLVANEASDPWQMSLFKRVAVRDTLEEGFVSLQVSPYENLAFRLPIKSLPATFVISPQGEALLSYHGLLWESEFFQVVEPLSALNRTYEKAGVPLPKKGTPRTISIARPPTATANKLTFKEGSFNFDGKQWHLTLNKKVTSLKISPMTVSNFLLLEDVRGNVVYALPLEDNHMSYRMLHDTEIWEPFFIIQKR